MPSTEAAGPGSRLQTILRVHQDEVSLVWWLTALFATTQTSFGLSANAADALFFRRFGIEQLPVMILLSGVAVMGFTIVHATGVAYAGSRRWLWRVTAAAAAWAILERLGIGLGNSAIYPVIWISTQVIIMVTLTVMWNTAEAACTTRQAKRLYPLFATAGVGGGIIGNVLTGPLASWLGTENLLVAQSLLLVGSTFLLLRLRPLLEDDEAGPVSAVSEARAAIGAIRSSRLLKLAAVSTLLISTLFFLVVFPFNEIVDQSFGSEAEIAGFLGLFSSIATAATFLFSLFVTNRLFARVGVIATLLIVPLTYVGGFGLWLGAFGLTTAIVFRGVQWVSVYAIFGTACPALFNVLTGRRRGQVMAFMTAVPAQLGTMAAGGILIAGDNLTNAVEFSIGLVIAVGALAAVIAMRPAYLEAIVEAVRRGLVGVLDEPVAGLVSPVDGDAKRILFEHLRDPRPEARTLAIAGLARFGDTDAVGKIETSMADENPAVRAAAFDSMCAIDPSRISSHTAVALSDEDPEVRLRALRYLTLEPNDEAVFEATRSLEDPDPRVRAVAAALIGGDAGDQAARDLIEGGDVGGVTALLEETARIGGGSVDARAFLAADEPGIRAAAARAHAASGGDPAALLPGLDDNSLRVRAASADAMARSEEGRSLLLEVLSTGSVRSSDAALRALTPMERFDPEFTDWAASEAERAALLESYRRALVREESTDTGQYLIRVLGNRRDRLMDWVLIAVTTEDNAEIMPVVERGIRSDDAETKSQAIEALEVIGDRHVMEVLLPLLEPDGAGSELGTTDALHQMSADFDPWLRALAVRSLAERAATEMEELRSGASDDLSGLVREAVPSLPAMTVESVDAFGPMDRVLALQRVPMFHELDPEDLELIAANTSEVNYSPGERVYSEGDEGDEMLIIISGRAVVTTTRRDEVETVGAYGPGDHVGELSLLSGDTRAADVTAGDEGIHGLVLGKSALLSILDERPSVALGMMETLAHRLADQT